MPRDRRPLTRPMLRRVLLGIADEAEAWRKDHPGSEDAGEPDYASGLLAAVHDVCEATGVRWPSRTVKR